MEKIKIVKRVGYLLTIDTDCEYEGNMFPLDKLQEFLTRSKEKGSNFIRLTGDFWDNELESIVIDPLQVTLESDEDYEKRLAEIESKRLAKENVEKAKEKALYESLKLKYG